MKNTIKLHVDSTVDIFNQAVGREFLFRNEADYKRFLQGINKYIKPIAYIRCYSLLPDHFHMVVTIKSEQTIWRVRRKRKKSWGRSNQEFILQTFKNLFISYAIYYNKKYKRKGALFVDRFKRKELLSLRDLHSAISYTIMNPVHHGYCKKYTEWKWSKMIPGQSAQLLHNFDSITPLRVEFSKHSKIIYSKELGMTPVQYEIELRKRKLRMLHRTSKVSYK